MEEGATDIDQGNAKFGGQEATVIFDRVFVPYEHVFMNGEIEFASELYVSLQVVSHAHTPQNVSGLIFSLERSCTMLRR